LEPPSEPFSWLLTVFIPITFYDVLALLLMLVLLFLSALFSGSEVAFFSLSPQDEKELGESESKNAERVRSLLALPKRLLATILIANNFVNVAIIILSTLIIDQVFDVGQMAVWLRFTLQVVAVTFLILLIGEVMPKVYATKNALRLAGIMSGPIVALRWFFGPISEILVKTTSIIDKRVAARKKPISVDELGQALELTRDKSTRTEDHKILEGIVKFGNTDVKQIMTPRTDVAAFDLRTPYSELMAGIIDSGFSRIPIYQGSFDKIKGILYIKDLIPFLDQEEEPDWKNLLRDAFFVPENKMIDDLLADFQEKKMHLAIVVDEYGGSSGIVSLEDVLEEIVGEITDEFDDEENIYSKLDERTFVFEGKIPLNDVYRILDIDGGSFEKAKGGSDTLAGFIVEQEARIPKKNEEVRFENYRFIIEAADQRKINRVKVHIEEEQENEV